MSERLVTHATFVTERTYDADPARVFAAWVDPKAKGLWFGGLGEPMEGWEDPEHELDFRVGGREVGKARHADGPVHAFDARYQDIVEDERIVYSYDMHLDDQRISVSLATVELKAEGAGTRLVFTEQGAFLDGHDTVELREEGTKSILDALGAHLDAARAGTSSRS